MTQYNHEGSPKRKPEGSESEGDVITKAKITVIEIAGRRPGTKELRQSLKAEKDKGLILPRSFRGVPLCQGFALSLLDPFTTSDT